MLHRCNHLVHGLRLPSRADSVYHWEGSGRTEGYLTHGEIPFYTLTPWFLFVCLCLARIFDPPIATEYISITILLPLEAPSFGTHHTPS